MRTSEARHDGFVTIATAALLAILLSVAGLVATLGAVAVLRHRAAAAADLGALAAAQHAAEGPARACAAARTVVQAQGARLHGCRLEGLDAVVEVGVVGMVGLGRLVHSGEARAVARAGPLGAAAGNPAASRPVERVSQRSSTVTVRA